MSDPVKADAGAVAGLDFDAIKARRNAVMKLVFALAADAEKAFRLSIPARDDDADMLMSALCADVDALLAAAQKGAEDTAKPDRFTELLDAYASAVHQNGRVAGMDSLSAYHEEDEVDEETPKAALLRYLHDIETRCDPAGEVQRIASLEEQVRGLEAKLAARHGEETDEDRDVLFEERARLREVAFCFASAIRSGESWTPTLEAMLSRATAPWQEIARDLAARAANEPSRA